MPKHYVKLHEKEVTIFEVEALTGEEAIQKIWSALHWWAEGKVPQGITPLSGEGTVLSVKEVKHGS